MDGLLLLGILTDIPELWNLVPTTSPSDYLVVKSCNVSKIACKNYELDVLLNVWPA